MAVCYGNDATVPHVGLTENAGHEIAGHKNTGHEFARHDKYRMKIDYITLECAFLLNSKSFVCKASVLRYIYHVLQFHALQF